MGNQCQSCGMPLKDETILGSNADGTKHKEYCNKCYKNGGYLQNCTMEEMIEMCLPRMKEVGIPTPVAKLMLKKGMPKLKRWKNTL